MEKKFYDLIEEEIERIVKKYEGIDKKSLDYDLHLFSVVVIKEYSKAIASVEKEVYELPERIEK